MASRSLGPESESVQQAARDLSRDGANRAQQLDLSGTQALRRLVPLDIAKKLIFSGEIIDGERAVALGLGTEISDQPLEDALELARVIAQRSPDAIRAAKRLLNASGLVTLAEGLANEMTASAGLMGGANQIEAVMAKLEKRPPKFIDAA